MQPPLFIADRASLDHASDLIARYGRYAGDEAASRAVHSRDLGNMLHFCRWRQVERVIQALSAMEARGTVQ